MGEKSVYMRVREDSRRALRMFGAQLQAQTGENVTDAESVEQFIRKYAPELLERARAIGDDSDTQDQTENES